MPQIVALSQQIPLSKIPITGSGSGTGTGPVVIDNEAATFQFVAGWILLITVLVFANKSRLGHVIIYYSLLLMILFVLVTEYMQIVPLLNAASSIGDFNAANPINNNFTQTHP